MKLDSDSDLEALARRVVARLRAPADLRADLIQQALLVSLDLLERFQPRTGPDEFPPRVQAERYLFVSVQWHLRSYIRSQRSLVAVSDRDQRLARAYRRLQSEEGSVSIVQAAQQLAVKPSRLAEVIGATSIAESLDRVDSRGRDGDLTTLAGRLAEGGPGTEDLAISAIMPKRTGSRSARSDSAETGDVASGRGRLLQTRRLLYQCLDGLPDSDAEMIRLAFALHRNEVGSLRSCRSYGCRQDTSHTHSTSEIARWLGADGSSVAKRLHDALDDLRDTLGGRDPVRLIEAASARTVVLPLG